MCESGKYSPRGVVENDADLVEADDPGDEIDIAYQTKHGRRYASIVPLTIQEMKSHADVAEPWRVAGRATPAVDVTGSLVATTP